MTTQAERRANGIDLLRSRGGTNANPEAAAAGLVSRHGALVGSEVAGEAQLVLFDRSGTTVSLEANTGATVLLLGGAPIDEPVVGYGPFVMTSEPEIRQAIADLNSGKFARAAV